MPRPALTLAIALLAGCDPAALTRPDGEDLRIVAEPPPPSPPVPSDEPSQPAPPRLVSEAPRVSEPPPATSDERSHVESKEADAHACPDGMVVVHGDFCTEVTQDCLRWLDERGPYGKKRCAEFARPTPCVGPKKHLRFCIDREELARKPGDVPLGGISWSLARETCEAREKRLCLESEWLFACEGEAALPYPTGFVRDSKRCNFDQTKLVSRGKVVDHRAPPSKYPDCTSPFGALEMVGNVDEWVWRDLTAGPHRAALKGGWWLGGRNRCRPTTTEHDEGYSALQTGARCCKDAL